MTSFRFLRTSDAYAHSETSSCKIKAKQVLFLECMVVSKRATNYVFVTARWTFPGKLYMANCSFINLTVWEQHYVWRKDLAQACTSMFHSIFAVLKKDWSVLLWLFSHQSSTGEMNCSTSIAFCSISYNGYCIINWKILKPYIEP